MISRRAFLVTATAALARPRRARAAEPASFSFASTSSALGLTTQVIRRLDLEKKYDLKLDVKLLDPAAAEKTVLLRQADTGLFPVITAADVSLKGQALVLYAPLLYMHTFMVVWQDSPYQKFADLRGKRIALLDKVSGAYRGMEVLAGRAGMSFEKDFQVVTAPPPAVIVFLQRKQADAIVIHEPLVSKLLAEGKFRVVMGLNDEWRKTSRQNWLFLCAAAYRDWLDQNRAAAKRLCDMLVDAARQINKNPDLIEAEAAFLGLKTKTEIDLARERMPQFYPGEWNEAVVAGVFESVREAARLGQIKQAPGPELVALLR
jgi:ABC-type nitrate/sulfonate/bicarbonate transport system substrate-binding protein